MAHLRSRTGSAVWDSTKCGMRGDQNARDSAKCEIRRGKCMRFHQMRKRRGRKCMRFHQMRNRLSHLAESCALDSPKSQVGTKQPSLAFRIWWNLIHSEGPTFRIWRNPMHSEPALVAKEPIIQAATHFSQRQRNPRDTPASKFRSPSRALAHPGIRTNTPRGHAALQQNAADFPRIGGVLPLPYIPFAADYPRLLPTLVYEACLALSFAALSRSSFARRMRSTR